MIGAFIGDMAGSIYEFDNIKTKQFEFLSPNCRPTDDSVLTAAIGRALMESDIYYQNTGDLVVKYMCEFGKMYPNSGYGGRFWYWLTEDEHLPYNSWGNGAAMRVSAAGFFARSREEAKDISRKVTEVTHNHPEGLKGAEAVAVAIWLARSGQNKSAIEDYIDKHYYDMNFTLDGIREEYDFDVSCGGSVPQALKAFFEATDFEDAVRNAISIGGDSDTIASIAGAVAEAYYGVPEPLRKRAYELLNTSEYRYLLAWMEIFEKCVQGYPIEFLPYTEQVFEEWRKNF